MTTHPTTGGNSDPKTLVEINDEFWDPVRQLNRDQTLPNQFEKLQSRIANLERAAGLRDGEFEGPYHNDPPVYKWVEAASYVWADTHDPELKAQLDTVVDIIQAAQQDDGYLHSNFILEHDLAERWTNLGIKHELFAIGHLIEAAIAHHTVTKEETLLRVACTAADHVDTVFGPDRHTGYPGHPEIELALVALYRETGVQRYLDLAMFFIDQRGRADSRFQWEFEHEDQIAGSYATKAFVDATGSYDKVDLYTDSTGAYDGSYSQDHLPVREQTEAVGHAVKAMFLYAGMTDVALETGDESLIEAVQRLWTDMTTTRMYVTGGIGARAKGEAFGAQYELPNESAYAESCAAFGSIIWNYRLLQLTGDGKFGDELERALYNGFLAGMSLDGTEFNYTNPLAHEDGRHRQPWYETSCCPPNIARLIASLERYAYVVDPEAGMLRTVLYLGTTIETELNGTSVRLEQQTDYPWTGNASFELTVDQPTKFSLALRLPAYASSIELHVNGDSQAVAELEQDGFAVLERHWETGDQVDLNVGFDVERLVTHPNVDANTGRVALRRGPLVYCVEQVDHEYPIDWLHIPDDAAFTIHDRPELFGGITTIQGEGVIPDPDLWADDLYQRATTTEMQAVEFEAIPYYAWDNRESGSMRVWLHAR